MKKHAYLTFLSSDLYVYYVLALYESWLTTKSKYEFYCVVTEEVSKKTKQILTAAGVPQLALDTADITAALKHGKNITTRLAYFNSTKKLKFFALDQFDKCLYVDSDMLIYQNLDHLFDCPDFSAVEDTITETLEDKYKYFNGMTIFNGGLFVFSPNKSFYNQILQDLNNLPDIDEKWRKTSIIYDGWNDQSLFAYYNQDWLSKPELHLSQYYNQCVKERDYRKPDFNPAEIKIKHFIGNKINIIEGKTTIVGDLLYKDWFNYIKLINGIILAKKLDLKLLNASLLIKRSVYNASTKKAETKHKDKPKQTVPYLYF